MSERDDEIEALRARVAELEESEQRFRTICENAPVMIDAFDVEGRRTLWNRECVKRLGYTQEDVESGVDPLAASVTDPGELAVVQEAIQRADGVFHEFRPRAKSGEERVQMWADFRLPTGALIAVGVDVTEQRAMEQQLRHTQKLDALGQLTGGIAHDFNNLLTVVMTNAELIKRRSALAVAELTMLEQVQVAARRGADLVRKLLAFSRSEMLVVRPIDVVAQLRELVPTLRRLLPETIKVSVDAGDVAPWILADAGAFEQVVMNLATNARDAMPDGGELRISVRASEDGQVLVRVRDTGAGMSPETRARACEPFFTTKARGQGTGLGLAIVYGLMGQHDGSVEIVTAPDAGTEISLMFRRAERAPRVAASAEPHIAAGAERLLVVEDEAPIREAACAALEEAGYVVTSAVDGRHALALLSDSEPVALVVSDVVMPHMTGPQLRDALDPATRPPFLFTTGYPAGYGAATGIADERQVLRKPWTASELVAAVRRALDEL